MTTMTDPVEQRQDLNAALGRTLGLAIAGSGKPRYVIAREAGMHKDTLLRAIRGTRALTPGEAVRLFSACGTAPIITLYFVTKGRDDLAARYMHHPLGQFLEELLAVIPGSLQEALDDRLDDLRPSWAAGAAKLVARRIADHLRQFDERDLAAAAAR
jgi:antitoxin HigA-1